jgi:hypothetical protein
MVSSISVLLFDYYECFFVSSSSSSSSYYFFNINSK